MFYFTWYVSLQLSKLCLINDPLTFFFQRIFVTCVFKKQINSKCLKSDFISNHTTCKHIYTNNLTRTKISLTKNYYEEQEIYYYVKMWYPWLYKPMDYSSTEKFPDFHLYHKRMRASLMAKINRKLIEN